MKEKKKVDQSRILDKFAGRLSRSTSKLLDYREKEREREASLEHRLIRKKAVVRAIKGRVDANGAVFAAFACFLQATIAKLCFSMAITGMGPGRIHACGCWAATRTKTTGPRTH